MKKTQRSHNSTLNNVGKGSSFKHRRDPKFMAYLARLQDRMPCDVCGRVDWYRVRAHLEARSQGGDDVANVVFLCADNLATGRIGCHSLQEKDKVFMAEHGERLYERAAEYVEMYETDDDPFFTESA